jgi:hypothetical protein
MAASESGDKSPHSKSRSSASVLAEQAKERLLRLMQMRTPMIYQVAMVLKVLIHHLPALEALQDLGANVRRPANSRSIAQYFRRLFDRADHLSLF